MSETYQDKNRHYLAKRKKLSGIFFETALPNEYLVPIGQKKIKPILGGKKFKLFKKFLRVPSYVQSLNFKTDNANLDYQGIGIEGYASWRIDPSRPEVAIATLDFFDEDDPMEKTNQELKTICVEAVRHVIANMTINDALRKKDEIAQNLKSQLKEIEAKWGILFDEVGIESVRIMSSKLFEDLQSKYRDQLRLEKEKTRIQTDREIAAEDNTMREKTELEKLETDKKIELVQVENNSKIRTLQIQENERIFKQEKQVEEERFRREIEFEQEKKEKDFAFQKIKKELDIELQAIEQKYLSSEKLLEGLTTDIQLKKLEVEKFKRELSQIYSSEALLEEFIKKLPEIYKSLKIDQYSVLDAGKGDGISPVGKLLSELVFLFKKDNLFELFQGKDNKQDK